MKIFLVIAFAGFVFKASAQPDSTDEVLTMKSVNIRALPIIYFTNPLNAQTISRKDIEELQPEDVGQLLQKFPGISMKSYGGLGGLKTFSFRSLGSQHTATVLDGFTVLNAQSGQLNLGQIQTSNLESVSIGEQIVQVKAPVSSLVMANELVLRTFEGTEHENTQKIRSSVKLGSFGQSDNYLGYHFGKKKFGFTVHAKYRQAQGEYPFSLKIGNFNYDGRQTNNQLKELYSGLSLFYRPNQMKQPIRLIYRNSFIDQGLPGAVVLYNNTDKQYLKTENHSVSMDWEDKWGFTNVRYYAQYQYNEQNYLDSHYLNTQGFLERNFYQSNANLGLRFLRNKFGELIQFYGGIEQGYSFLNFSDGSSIHPQRWTTYSSAGLHINEKKYMLDMRFGHQLVNEIGGLEESTRIKNLFSPYLHFETYEKGRFKWKYGFTTSTTSRLPSFNELYYAQVGNQELKPEKVRQFVLTNGFSIINNKWQWRNSIQLYFNQIEDKILSIPTKNLFIWSIQNVGLVHASGLDFNQYIKREFFGSWWVDLNLNYSYQRSINRTDKNDVNYGSQIAYIPEHNGNADVTIRTKKSGCRFSSSFIGERYSLNENIPSNLLEPFVIFDASIFHTFNFNYKREEGLSQKLTLQFQVKNILNQNYTYVRNFVMPGRNFLISISYAL